MAFRIPAIPLPPVLPPNKATSISDTYIIESGSFVSNEGPDIDIHAFDASVLSTDPSPQPRFCSLNVLTLYRFPGN